MKYNKWCTSTFYLHNDYFLRQMLIYNVYFDIPNSPCFSYRFEIMKVIFAAKSLNLPPNLLPCPVPALGSRKCAKICLLNPDFAMEAAERMPVSLSLGTFSKEKWCAKSGK